MGVKLFLKPGRCSSPKCATVRRPARPGMHGKSRRRALSEYGMQLHEKQKFQFSYGISEIQMKKIFKKALKSPKVTGEVFISLLERRIDNVVFRLGFAPSRSVGRQLVGHGHILVNGRKTTIPSYIVRVGDVISVKPSSRELVIFKDLKESLLNYDLPIWLKNNPEKLEGEIIDLPREFDMPFDINSVVDYYSKVVK